MSSKRRAAEVDSESEHDASAHASASEGEEERKSQPASPAKAKGASSLRSYTMTEDDEEAEWNTQRDEAAEAAALQAQLSGQKQPAKKRRLHKASEEDAKSKTLSYRSAGLDEDGLDDFVVDDLGVGGAAGDDDYDLARDKKLLTAVNVQEAFQPGSTPLAGTAGAAALSGVEKGDMRFLAYNLVGNITSLQETTRRDANGEDIAVDDSDRIHMVQINYADTAKHKATKFRDYFGFRMAALGAHGAVFASPRGWDKKDKKELPSTIFFRPSDSWDSKATSEWTLHLPLTGTKEEVVGVALGDTWVAVGTSRQFVRLVSHTGVQTFTLSLPGPLVSMVGSADTLALVFHDGVPLPGHQNLGLIVMDCVKRREVYRGKCVISPRATLTWLGFSDQGLLLNMDSYGVLRALCRSWGSQWSPVLETHLLRKAGSLEVHWPVSVLEDKLFCLVLPDGKRHPTAGKRSAQSLQTVTLQLPFLALDQQVAQHEEQHARRALLWYNDRDGGLPTSSRFYTSKQEMEQDKLVIALFQRACRGDYLARALDLATMLYRRKSLEIAEKMAVFEKKSALAGRLHMLLAVKFPPKPAGHAAEEDDAGLASFLNLDSNQASSAAAAGGSSGARRGKLVRPSGVSFAEAEAANARGDDDEGEAEYSFGSPKGILKPSQGAAPASSQSAFASSSLAIRPGQLVQSANVKQRAKGATTTPASQASPKKNPFANKQ